MIGRTLGVYRIVEQIGQGGMATVYKAYDPTTDRYVAIKVLPEYYTHDEKFHTRFKREAKAIAKLEHPHILPIFAYGEEEGITYMVMRYLPYGTLKERIQQGALALEEAERVLTQMADALDYAHTHGVLHRDVKPSNMLLDERGNAYLSDFGIARMVEGSVSVDLTAGGIIGTPAYMSPEQCRGTETLTPASDQFSLGVVLYEMLTGRTPFQAETPLALVYMQIHEPLPPPRSLRPDLPEGAERVVLKALAKEPEQRHPDCNTMAEMFGAVVAEMPQTARSRPATLTPRPTSARPGTSAPPDALTSDVLPAAETVADRESRRAPVWAIGLVMLVVVAGLIGGAFMLGRTGGEQPGSAGTAAPSGRGTDAGGAIPSTPVPASTRSLPASAVYDEFSDPAYDGAFNELLWQAGSSDLWTQQDGVLVARQVGPGEADTCNNITAAEYADYLPDAPLFFEADMVLNSEEHDGVMSIMINGSRPEDWPFHREIHCLIRSVSGSATAELSCFDRWNMGPHTFEDTYNTPATRTDLATWHKARIEIDPATGTLTYYLDGERVGSHTPNRAEELRTARFTFFLEICTSSSEAVTGYVDNVYIGTFAP